ncbi:MAG TPA: SDR family oxidoreductase [Candidatus Limnocylindria bacterium]|jgi:NAD(P)-dependent dehydrogenase (short-subunit alcohol dehydrogenase family)|nr:SDR family oxidoreductase [Candidatus Limnocylindria bacterium]
MVNPIDSNDTMRGKVAMVTGANSGMGKEISLALAGKGATVVMVCRDPDKGESARADVQQNTGNGAVELLVADLSSQQSIRNLVREFAAHHDKLNVLVNNAGVLLPKRTETVDGVETVFATNHLGPFLLTNLLLPMLTAGAPARVVTVSSSVEGMGKIDFDDLQSAKSYDVSGSYNASKLANLLFTYELSRRLKGTGITANAVEPGFVKTNLKVPFPFSLFSFMRGSAVDGARPTVFLASSPEVEGVSGKYFSHKGVATKSSKTSNDEDVARRLWETSAKLTHLDPTQARQA